MDNYLVYGVLSSSLDDYLRARFSIVVNSKFPIVSVTFSVHLYQDPTFLLLFKTMNFCVNIICFCRIWPEQ